MAKGLWLLLAWVTVSTAVGAAPTFWFRDLSGQKVGLRELSGQSPSGFVVCVLWCSHCASCRAVESELEELQHDFKGRALVVGVDASVEDDAGSISDYLREHDRHFRVVLDPPGGLADQLHITLTTTTVIFDPGGSIRYLGQLGSSAQPKARIALQELLDDKPLTQSTTPFWGCPIRRPGSR